MKEFQEEKLLTDMCQLLINELPKELLIFEEDTPYEGRLPPFRYVGPAEKLPPGTGMPFAFVEIVAGEYTEKDRIIKNTVYQVKIQLKMPDYTMVWRYFAGIGFVFGETGIAGCRVNEEKRNKNGEMWVRVVV